MLSSLSPELVATISKVDISVKSDKSVIGTATFGRCFCLGTVKEFLYIFYRDSISLFVE
jgi:hypothetical protein